MHNYIISRRDQDPAQIVLQGIHAALVCRAVPDEDALVFLTVVDEKELLELADQIEDSLKPYRYTEEINTSTGDVRDELNAIAVRQVQERDRHLFRHLKKWKLPELAAV